MKNQDVLGRALLAMFAFAVLANCANADIESAQEHQGTGRIVVKNDSTAAIGQGEHQVKTPWMIVSPDGRSGFANDFTTNAISVVTEDGTNYYAHVQGENNDRTKIVHFTVDKNGIPSSHGDVIDTTLSAEENNQEKMKNRKLIGINRGYLHFCSSNDYWIYNPKTKDMVFGEDYPQQCMAVYQDNSSFYRLNNYRINFQGMVITGPDLCKFQGSNCFAQKLDALYEGGTAITVLNENEDYLVGDVNGQVLDQWGGLPAHLPGPISGLSNNGEEVFATTESTNAFYNVTEGGYNVVRGENGQLKPMIPPTTNGLLRVIDNRRKDGKFLCVTRKGIHSIEE